MLTAMATPGSETTPRIRRGAQIRLLADDLTGACDAGVAFRAAGHSVRAWFGARVLYPVGESAQAFHTASRDLGAHEAAEAVARAAGSLDRDPGTILFKKVDSAGRGPIGAELLAAHRALGTRAILFVPAFPAMGRTVQNGILEIRDADGECRQVHLGSLSPAEMRIAPIAHAGDLAPALDSGNSLLLCDSETEEDLNALARAAEQIPGLLYAGSAGLARAIASLHPAPAPAASRAAAERILVVAGSPHPVTQLQLAQLESAQPVSGKARILRVACGRGEEERVRAEIRAAFEALDPEALVLTGGETAQLAAEALGADSILLQAELAPGIPWGVLQGGRVHGRLAVTKSGGFGAVSALCAMVEKLSGAA
jgi:D-threonate/D-erythronate kinase